jgi:hypothetical protein
MPNHVTIIAIPGRETRGEKHMRHELKNGKIARSFPKLMQA